VIAGNHNDSYDLITRLKDLFQQLDQLELAYTDAYFNADSAFDTKEARNLLWNRGVRPNIPENKRNRKRTKRGRKRHFNPGVQKALRDGTNLCMDRQIQTSPDPV
jgi:hypothetical protein